MPYNTYHIPIESRRESLYTGIGGFPQAASYLKLISSTRIDVATQLN